MRKSLKWVVCMMASVGLVACSGGGGNSDPAPSNNTSTYSISGTITSSGFALQGVTMTLGSSTTTTTDASGNYSFAGITNGVYTLTPSKNGYTFTPTNSTQTVNNANITAVNFAATVAPSTVALFYFDEGTGSTSADSSPNHLLASISGGATWVPGKSGSALSFDNGTAEANVAYSLDYLGSSTVSVEAWLYPNSTCAAGTCLIVGDSFSWLLRLNDGTVEFWINYGLGSQWAKLVSSSAAIGTNAWHHVAATYNGDRATLYVDGMPDATASAIYTVGDDSSHRSIAIGGSSGCCGYMDYIRSFPGIIDNVRISQAELSASQIAAEYNTTK